VSQSQRRRKRVSTYCEDGDDLGTNVELDRCVDIDVNTESNDGLGARLDMPTENGNRDSDVNNSVAPNCLREC
jgi:hypothetical protein